MTAMSPNLLPLYGLALLCLLVGPVAGCAALSSRDDEVFSYEVMKRQIEGPDPSTYREIFEQSPGPRSSKGLIDGLAPESLSDSLKRTTGYGPKPDEARQLYAEAEALYNEALTLEDSERQQRFAEAAERFSDAAKKWPDSALEQDALFLAGEANYFADRFPQANKKFEILLKKYPNSPYLDLIEARRFSLAQYWLETSNHLGENFFSTNLWDKKRPWRDTRGEGLRIFDRIRIDDPTGRLADDATMAAANTFFREGKFVRADEYYSDLRKTFPSSEHQFMAHFLGVQAKLRSYQGADYSGVPLEEANELLEQIRKQFPAESQEHREELARMQREVRFRLAEREWSTAKYYERQQAYAAARFYYDIVAHEYDDTPFAQQSRTRMAEIADLPDRPPQYFQWLADRFPATEQPKPLLATRPTASNQR